MFEMEQKPSDPIDWLRKNLGVRGAIDSAAKDTEQKPS
jgi:hypothetical protein